MPARREQGTRYVSAAQITALSEAEAEALTVMLNEHARKTNHSIEVVTMPDGGARFRWWPNF